MPTSGVHLAMEALGIKHGGGATVLKDLLVEALSAPRFSKVSVFCSPRSVRTFEFPVSPLLNEIEVPQAEFSRFSRLWWLERRMEAHLRSIDANVLLCLGGAGRSSQIPCLTFIQQSLPFCPEALALLSRPARWRIRAISGLMRRSCQASAAVLVQTETMRKAVLTAFGIEPGRVHAFRPSVHLPERCAVLSDGLAAMRKSRPGFRLLYVGSQSKYKNVKTLLAAVRKVRKQFADVTLFLTWPTDHPVHGRDGIMCLGYLQAGALTEAYQLADLVVMPSLVETVGLPMLEAMSMGTPVLAADRPYARELCEDAAVFFDPLDVDDLVNRISGLLADNTLRAEMALRSSVLIERYLTFRPYRKMLDAVIETTGAGKNPAVPRSSRNDYEVPDGSYDRQ